MELSLNQDGTLLINMSENGFSIEVDGNWELQPQEEQINMCIDFFQSICNEVDIIEASHETLILEYTELETNCHTIETYTRS